MVIAKVMGYLFHFLYALWLYSWLCLRFAMALALALAMLKANALDIDTAKYNMTMATTQIKTLLIVSFGTYTLQLLVSNLVSYSS